jgi:2,4-dienoyl-CoA reductase-like NADH-dependent reductase (Old Yellow Enzyme family)
MAQLFDKIVINSMALKNRSVRSATWTGLAETGGHCGRKLMALTQDLVKGEVGLIITGFAYVMPNGQALPGQLAIHNDTVLPGLKELTRRVHKGKGRIAMQIVHAGAQTVMKPGKDGPVWGPSPVPEKVFKKTPKAMTQREIKGVVRAFGEAAVRVKRAGFDAVELHGAHGYLIAQFLSPARNKRTDKYGGSIENRARFLFEVYRAVRKGVGKDFPVLIKLNTKDFIRGGLSERDALFVARALDRVGIDAIELSGGVPAAGEMGPARPRIRKAQDEAYFLPLARKIRKKVSVPIILVGGIRSFKVAEDILKTDAADMVSMARPFIREPRLIKRWLEGDRRKATCISCNKCFGAAMGPEGLHCAVEKRIKARKREKR